MFEYITNKLTNDKGAMDRIFVSLLLIILGVGALAGFSVWINTKAAELEEVSIKSIEIMVDDTQNNTNTAIGN